MSAGTRALRTGGNAITPIVLALGAALGWGVADFIGGFKSRSVPLVSVLAISQAAALFLLCVIVTARGTAPPGDGTLYYAALSGISEMVGVAALYRGLAVGTMSLVAPAAALAPVIPLLAGLMLGEVPGSVQGIGLALAISGMVVASVRRASGVAAASRVIPSILYGLVAALGFGGFFYAMDIASEGDIPWAMFVARLTAVTTIVIIMLVRRSRPAASRGDLPPIASIGALVVAADALYATATTVGLVGIAAVLASLHTVVTMGLAGILLHERLERLQQLGIVMSLCGVLAISVSR